VFDEIMLPLAELAGKPPQTAIALPPVTPAEAEGMFREPAAAVPADAAARLGSLRLFAVAYIACGGEREFATDSPPQSDTHSSLWLERDGGFDLFLSLRDTNPHDAGFELLAAVADLLVPRFGDEEFAAWAALLERELNQAAEGEIDEDALEARRAMSEDYAAVSLASTVAEYMHALWHDVHVRQGPGHLEPQFLRRRLEWLRELFPPNPGYRLFP
jgi:hypothetical protein